MGKIVNRDEFIEIRKSLKQQEKKIILCHGVFDLVHPGHLLHLEEAKSLGDILVVSITAARYVRKGPGRPYFNDEMRLKFLSNLSLVDYVLLSEEPTVSDILAVVRPDLYVKGEEYAKSEDDLTGKIDEEAELVRSYGGEIYFTLGQTFSSTKLLNNNLPVISPQLKSFMLEFRKKYSFAQVKELIDSFSDLSILVVGDVILDEYVFCNIQGLMSKDQGYSVRYEHSERYLGGALAIANHLSSFSKQVTVSSLIGEESDVHSRILNELGKDMKLNLDYVASGKTIVKKRYVLENKMREEFNKIFSVNIFPEKDTMSKEKQAYYQNLKGIVDSYDLVVLCDFGHGLIDEEIMDILQSKAKFLAVNCQTNSSNLGMNLITKYKRADVFSLDQRELRLAFVNQYDTDESLLKKLQLRFKNNGGWLTQGSTGALGINSGGDIFQCPALTLRVKDTIGAGDAFFALASMAAVRDSDYNLSTFIGNIGGALASNIVGNAQAVGKVDVLKYINTLLNF